jgi:hypothetical protein
VDDRNHLHIHLHLDGVAELTQAVRHGLEALGITLTTEGHAMSAELDALTADVAATRGVMPSAIVLIQSLAQRLIDAGTNPAALEALRADLAQGEAALSAAVAANPS